MKAILKDDLVNSILGWAIDFDNYDEGCYEQAVELLSEVAEEIRKQSKENKQN